MAGTSGELCQVRPKRKSAEAARSLFASGILEEGCLGGLSSDEEDHLDRELCPSSSDSESEPAAHEDISEKKRKKVPNSR